MTPCEKHGCEHLETRCKDCGRLIMQRTINKGSSDCTAMDATPSKECKEYHENSHIQFNVPISMINKEKEWIRVKDRLPDFDLGYVLIYCPRSHGAYDGIFTAIWHHKGFHDWPPNCGCSGFASPSHWMPLPQPPKE